MNPYQQIPEEKREKILQATIKEFAQKGYEKASTNHIVQEAEISKGLLFHYFGNKEKLFLATFDYCVEKLTDEMMPHAKGLSKDLFKRILQLGKLKVRLFAKYPAESKFILMAYGDVPPPIKEEILKRQQRMAEVNMPLALEGVNFGLLRKGIKPQKAIQYMMLVFEAIANKWIKRYLNEPDNTIQIMNEHIEELEEVMDWMKHGLYRKELDADLEKGDGSDDSH